MGKQVKVVVKTPTNYRPPTVTGPQVPTGTPLGGGAPTTAPKQTIAQTAKGAVPEATHPAPGAMAPKPPSNATTGPKIAKPSVDYNTQQGSRIPKGSGGAVDYSGEQAQQLQDKGGA